MPRRMQLGPKMMQVPPSDARTKLRHAHGSFRTKHIDQCNMKLRSLYLSTVCSLVFVFGCAHSPAGRDVQSTIVKEQIASRKLSQEEVGRLVALADHGDGEAAFRLYSHFALGEYNAELSQKYLHRSVELGWPAALYLFAFQKWTNQENPDVDEVFGLVSRAVKQGYPDSKGLLQEVTKAKQDGVVPRRSKLRFFP